MIYQRDNPRRGTVASVMVDYLEGDGYAASVPALPLRPLVAVAVDGVDGD
jgi:hypothetical protein